VNIFGFANFSHLTAVFGVLVKVAAVSGWKRLSKRFGREGLSVIHVYRHLSV
jgi:hypothetical protein